MRRCWNPGSEQSRELGLCFGYAFVLECEVKPVAVIVLNAYPAEILIFEISYQGVSCPWQVSNDAEWRITFLGVMDAERGL